MHLATVADLTRTHRESLAAEHASKAAAASALAFASKARLASSEGGSDPEISESLRAAERSKAWHDARCGGQLKRFDTIQGCGKKGARVLCSSCGVTHDFGLPCDVTRLCGPCSTRRAIERRARFGLARGVVIVDAERGGLLSPYRPRIRRVAGQWCASCRRHHRKSLECGGRWSEKFVTLTIPHFRIGTLEQTVGERITVLREAWRYFAREWAAHWRRVRKCADLPGERPTVYRAFEWTTGSDGAGHPHFHFWALSPWIDFRWLQDTWTRCLAKAGLQQVGAVRVHVKRIAQMRGDVARELLKGGQRAALRLSRLTMTDAEASGSAAVDYCEGWSIADVEDDVSDGTAAALYCALEGMRLAQGSRGFLRVAYALVGICKDCGDADTLVFSLTGTEHVQACRGPPLANTRGSPAHALPERERSA